jgi:hypothetical protein
MTANCLHLTSWIWLILNTFAKACCCIPLAISVNDSLLFSGKDAVFGFLCFGALLFSVLLGLQCAGLYSVCGATTERKRAAHRYAYCGLWVHFGVEVGLIAVLMGFSATCQKDSCYDSCDCFLLYLPTAFIILSFLTGTVAALGHSVSWRRRSMKGESASVLV